MKAKKIDPRWEKGSMRDEHNRNSDAEGRKEAKRNWELERLDVSIVQLMGAVEHDDAYAGYGRLKINGREEKKQDVFSSLLLSLLFPFSPFHSFSLFLLR